jgi:biopolymer transport protein ExbD
MRHWPSRSRRPARIEIIPMIDVMMFLLVFFVLISTNVLPALGLRVALPKMGDPAHLPPTQLVRLTATADGKLFLDGAALTADQLPARLHGMAQPGGKLAVVIAGDKSVPLQSLVDILDILKTADVPAATIVTEQK